MYSLMLERMLPGIVGVAETAVAVDVVQGQALQALRCDVVRSSSGAMPSEEEKSESSSLLILGMGFSSCFLCLMRMKNVKEGDSSRRGVNGTGLVSRWY
jgi:hypothetical protein